MASKNPFQIDREELIRKLDDPVYVQSLQADPAAALERVKYQTPLEGDVWIYRGVVIALGLAVLMTIGGAIYLAASATPPPEILIAIGSAAVGALAGLLAPPPKSS